MSANAFAFCLQTLARKICFLHSGANFNPSFISLLHSRQHYTNVSKKYNLVLYVFHIFCAMNKRIRLVNFSFYLIVLSYLIFISLHLTIFSLNIAAKWHHFYYTNRAQRDKMLFHMGQCWSQNCGGFYFNSLFINRKFTYYALGFKTSFCPVQRYCIMSPAGFFLELHRWSTKVF